MVGSVLSAGSDTVFVSLVRVTPRPYSQESTARPIQGAEVRLQGDIATVGLTEGPPGFPPCLTYHSSNREAATIPCYAAVFPGGVRPGGSYRLSILLPGGGTIEGAAKVPHTPAVIAPEADTRWIRRGSGDIDTLRVRWSASPGTAGVGFALQSHRVFYKGALVANADCTIYLLGSSRPSVHRVLDSPRTDSASLTYDVIQCTGRVGTDAPFPFRPDSVQARLIVTAYDTAYTRYREGPGGSSVRPEHITAGITGALGVFAGVASAQRRVTLVPEP